MKVLLTTLFFTLGLSYQALADTNAQIELINCEKCARDMDCKSEVLKYEPATGDLHLNTMEAGTLVSTSLNPSISVVHELVKKQQECVAYISNGDTTKIRLQVTGANFRGQRVHYDGRYVVQDGQALGAGGNHLQCSRASQKNTLVDQLRKRLGAACGDAEKTQMAQDLRLLDQPGQKLEGVEGTLPFERNREPEVLAAVDPDEGVLGVD